MISETRPRNFTTDNKTSGSFIEASGKFVLLKRADDKSYPGKWALPGGKVDEGETPREAVIREAMEETRIDISPNVVFYKAMFERYKDADFIYYIFRSILNKPEPVILSPEHSDFVWATPEEALEMDLIEDLDVCIKMVYPYFHDVK